MVVESGRTTTVNTQFPPQTDRYMYATIDGAPVTVFCATIGAERSCADDGWAEFQFLVPGTYPVTVEVDGHAPATGTATVVDKTISTVTVAVT